MKLIQILRHSKGLLLTLTLVSAITFIYGCQCEGGIGTSSENTNKVEITNNQFKSK